MTAEELSAHWKKSDDELAASAMVVAFLQNPWFRPNEHPRTVLLYRESATYRRMVLGLSATGRALERSLGSELFASVWWDNANPLHGETRRAQFPPDVAHMQTVLDLIRPRVVLLLGRQAQDGFARVKYRCAAVCGKHPMAMGSSRAHLAHVADNLRTLLS